MRVETIKAKPRKMGKTTNGLHYTGQIRAFIIGDNGNLVVSTSTLICNIIRIVVIGMNIVGSCYEEVSIFVLY